MRLHIDDILHGLTDLAGEVPFLVMDCDGTTVEASDGALDLIGGVLRIGDFRLRLSRQGERDLDGLGPLSQQPFSNESVTWTPPHEGPRRSFRLHSRLVPPRADQCKIVFLRLDPDVPDLTEDGGLLLRDPREVDGAVEFHGMWARSPEMALLFQQIHRVAESEATVLVRGESGTGKEHVARALHELSPRSRKPFVAVNCAALTPTLLESELFGHVKGAFTGAIKDHPGLFAQADGGTIFLDEVAEIPLDLQAKLLRVLQERTVTPVGGTQARKVDVRIISATHQRLREAVQEGRFREDLMYRLRVVPLFIPPLRERRGDIELLALLILGDLRTTHRHRFQRIHPEAMRCLLAYPWPGNVRELRNAMEYATVVGHGEVLGPDDLPPEFNRPNAPQPARTPASVETALTASPVKPEAEAIRQALAAADGNKQLAADALGIHRATLWRKMKKHGLA